jgi:protein-disulfide isomerase
MSIIGKVAILAAVLVAAQSSPATNSADKDERAQLAALVKQQFGSTFTLPEKFPTPLITGDFDGDGVEDVAIVADSKEPIPDSYAFKYDVADPYGAYFGFGNPAIASTFNATDPRYNHTILVIFGAGPEAWHAATPKAKFVIINVPFDNITTGRILLKKGKPPIFVIRAVESQIMDSNVFYDAKKKKWHWEPGQTLE